MGKIIAVWGTPNSGKTVFSMKLAESLYKTGRKKQVKVVVILSDVTAPSMPVIFPTYRTDDVYSIGDLLAKTSISTDEIFSYTTLVKGRDNFGVIGYKENENRRSHPEYTREKAKTFLRILAANTDFVIVDCMTNPFESVLSDVALLEADRSIRLTTSDLKCLSYWLAQRQHFENKGYLPPSQITVYNEPVPIWAGSAALGSQVGRIDYALPFSAALAKQAVEGTTGEELKDRKFMNVVDRIAKAIGDAYGTD